ncbi:MAG: glycosyltransferase family A protein, partial [Thermodesulfobacteriota bacterium]
MADNTVSVVVPVYNRPEYVREALTSVFGQTFKDYEVIVVDDGSTEDTKGALGEYLQGVNYFYKKNGGAASARNYGIEKSTGEYVAFLDSDDLWEEDKLDVQVEFLSRNPDVGLVCSDYTYIGRNEGGGKGR